MNLLGVRGGFNIAVPLGKGVSLSMTPADYVFVYPQGDWRNDYTSKFGLSYRFGSVDPVTTCAPESRMLSAA